MGNIFFTSDAHFGHKNIIKYCDRPFSSVEEMEEIICQKWNSVVTPGDAVYLVGDTFWANDSADSRDKVRTLMTRLKGTKIILPGNHDENLVRKISKIKDIHSITHKSQHIVMCHYPIRSWNRKYHGAIHVHGHTHGKKQLENPPDRAVHIGVDAWDFYPASFDQVMAVVDTIK